MTKSLLFLIFFFIVTATGHGQTLGFSLANGKKKVQIPIEIYSNLVVVPVVLNETLPLKFVLDTGVRTAILTQKTFSDILNLPYTRKYSIAGPGGVKVVDAYITNNVTIQLPGVNGRGHALLVLEEDYLELRNYLGTDVHGILGYELFSRFIVEINYADKLLTLYRPERFTKKRRFQTVPITVQDTKPFAVVPVVLQDGTKINAKLLMDSGASHALLLDPASDEKINVPENVVSSLIGRGLGGEITGKAGRIKSISLADYTINKVIANFPDPNSYMDSLKGGNDDRNGTIGGEILSRFTTIYNFPKEEVYLKKNASFKKGFHYNLSGLTIKAKGARLNVFEVTQVRDQSVSFKAGIEEGDIILSINGLESSMLDLNIVNSYLNRRPGKKIKLYLDRNGERLRKQFYLADQI
ncbi:MAG TPA: aspartyl protease family protein [Ohtaekwangia sp.]|nr:aspartyl protease family protein [Ohtaekwangia sp.]